MGDQICPIGQLTHTRRLDGVPEIDGDLKTVTTVKILHYHQLYLNRPDPIAFLPASVDTSGVDELPRNRINFVSFALLV